jgi:hypothetical protein
MGGQKPLSLLGRDKVLYEVNVLRESGLIMTIKERLPYNTNLKKYSQNLRCDPTDAER